jgi:uncharacterized protein (DUF433 family)
MTLSDERTAQPDTQAAEIASNEDAGVIEKRRKASAAKPVLGGTCVPVEAMDGYLRAGKSTAEIVEAFPSPMEEDIEAVQPLPQSLPTRAT